MRKHLVVALVAAPSLGETRVLGDFVPERYALDFDISLKKAAFSGRETIEGALAKPTASIVLHALGLTITKATVAGQAARVTADEGAETVTLAAPWQVQAGKVAIEIEFEAKLGKTLRGLYGAKVGRDLYALTQMEPTDARRAFPCIDEPAAKARFALRVTIDRDWQVVSNGALLDVVRKGGRKTFRFAETPRMSPYLVAIAAAPFVSKSAKSPSGVPVAVHALPDKIALLDYALETGVALLSRLEAYFGVPYPYGKLDLVAVPEFEAGAMENAGAIFFREPLLLADPKNASARTRRTIAIILAHEMAHQWFGNLVTAAWWDDIWLNEAFATWMEFKVVGAWKPEWNLWLDFQQMKRAPMALDALPTARAIRAEADTPAEINEMFDPITYEKGASVLRMLELFVGEEKFREGVRLYLRRHAEGNARAADLWAALGEASGRPVGDIAPGWIDQPGFPLLRVAMREKGGRTFAAVEQARHFARRRPGAGPARWKVPVCLRVEAGRGPTVRCELLEDDRAEWEVGDGAPCLRWIFPNAGQGGYFRARLEPRWLDALARNVGALAPEERIGLLDDQWALVESGDAAMPDFLAMLAGYRDEKTRPGLEALAGRLGGIRARYVAAAAMPAFERFAEATLGRAFADLGWDAGQNDDEERRLARATVVEALGATARARDVLGEAERRAARWRADPASLDPTLATTAVRLAAIRGDAKLWDACFARTKKTTEPEDRERHLFALAAFDDPVLLQRTLDASLGADVRKQDSARLVASVIANPAARDRAWIFVQAHFQELRERAGSFGIERVVRALGVVCDAKTRGEIADFFARHPAEEVKQALAETLEAIDLCIDVRGREEKRVAAWLESAR